MKIYRDVITGDEVLSDVLPIAEDEEMPIFLKVKGKLTTESCDVDDALIGANKSAEGGGDDGVDASSVSGINVVMNHKLEKVEYMPTKKEYTPYIKKYMKKVKEHLTEEKGEEAAGEWAKLAQSCIMKIIKDYKEYDLYTGESMNEEAMAILCRWDGETPYMYYIRAGLIEEKV